MNISMMTYKKYSQINIDSSPIGLNCVEMKIVVFAHQRSKIIGFAGVDGIHYCFVRGFGEMVFVVNPMNSPNHVHPLARTLEAF